MPYRGRPEPRSWLAQPDFFGRSHEVAWRTDVGSLTPLDRPNLLGAQRQHLFGLVVRDCLKRDKKIRSVAGLATLAGLTESGLRAILRGEAHLHVTHLVAVEYALKIDLFPTLAHAERALLANAPVQKAHDTRTQDQRRRDGIA